MAQEISTRVTNATANPRVVNNPEALGEHRVICDTMEVSAGSAADTAILDIRIPVDAIVSSLKIAVDDLGTSTTMSVGLYARDGGGMGSTFTAISAAAFVSALDVATAATAITEVRFSVKNIDTINKKAWELAGLSAKPSYPEFNLGVSFPAAVTAAGTVTAIAGIVGA